ncbi:MAG: TetR-like C-terminal domain-containing protein [Gemmatimonadaceae bacterium]
MSLSVGFTSSTKPPGIFPFAYTALSPNADRPRRETSKRAIRQALAAGERRADVPPDVAVDLLFGPMFYRLFVQHAPLNEAFITQLLHFTLEGLRVRPA